MTAAGPAAQAAKEAAAPPLSLLRPLSVRGRHPGLQGAAHRPAGDGPGGPPWTPGTPAAPGSRKSGQGTALPLAGRGRNKDSPYWPESQNRCLHAFRGTAMSASGAAPFRKHGRKYSAAFGVGAPSTAT